MRELHFTITGTEAGLALTPHEAQAGAQYDNGAQALVFGRPEAYADADLIIYLGVPQGRGAAPFGPLNLGDENTWTLGAEYTRYTKLKMQAAFFRDGAELAHTNIVTLIFDESISPREAAAPSIPHRLRVMEDGAFVDAEYDGNTLKLVTGTGKETAIPISGGGNVFAFEVSEDGDLILEYGDGTAPPDMHINEQGELIWQI